MCEIRINHWCTFARNGWCTFLGIFIQPLPLFNKYLKTGYLPIFTEGENEYLPKLEQIINAVVDMDLAYIA
ncbi:MAG TPA: hypothetical protein VFD72_01800, partial [Sphingobacteriaceae bacterium]|nr:hypothetical protein [Sphingobacteriaceae bacterium]